MPPNDIGDPDIQRPVRLLDMVRRRLRLKHYSLRTEEAYIGWIKRFIRFHGKRHPRNMSAPEVEGFLTHLAVEGRVSPSTQNQALAALLFLYRDVLTMDLPWLKDVHRAKRRQKLPVVLTSREVQAVLSRMHGRALVMAQLLYGSGLRLMECLRLRVKDVGFERREILVRDGKGGKDRVTMLPDAIVPALHEQIAETLALHADDLAAGFGEVYLPYALARKYPNAGREFTWQYIFPARKRSRDPRSGAVRRHHLDETVLQRAFKQAVHDSGIPNACHPAYFTPLVCDSFAAGRL